MGEFCFRRFRHFNYSCHQQSNETRQIRPNHLRADTYAGSLVRFDLLHARVPRRAHSLVLRPGLAVLRVSFYRSMSQLSL